MRLIIFMIILLGGMDLPIQPPVFQKKGSKGPGVYGPPPEQPIEDEDPRDAPPPVFFGEDVDQAKDSIVYVLDKSHTMLAGVSGMSVRRINNRMVAWQNEQGSFGNIQRGSSWAGANRWERAVAETLRSIHALSDNFKFEVIVYETKILPCFGRLVDANVGNKAKVQAWLLTFYPEGGTCSGPAVVAALDLKPDAIAFLSDGTPECNYVPAANNAEARRKHRGIIRRANTKPIPIRCFGIGIAPWNKAREFMQGVANDSGGSYVDVQ